MSGIGAAGEVGSSPTRLTSLVISLYNYKLMVHSTRTKCKQIVHMVRYWLVGLIRKSDVSSILTSTINYGVYLFRS